MSLGGFTAQGPRETNEDAFYVRDFSDVSSFAGGIIGFVMVTDGMGGYQGGDVASGLAVACAESYVGQLLQMAEGNRVELDARLALAEIARNAHEAILAETAKRGNARMGATFVGAFLSPSHAWVGHIGDSRAYLVRDGLATQLTEDHSKVGRMFSRGALTEEEAQSHPERNRIERALGFSDGDPEIDEVDLAPGDALLLCSDGVHTVLDASTLGGCVERAADAEGAARRAVRLALSRGTDDNATAVVARAVRPSPRGRRAGTLAHAVPMLRAVGGRRASRSARGVRDARERRPRASRSPRRPLWPLVAPWLVLVALVGALVACVRASLPQRWPAVAASAQRTGVREEGGSAPAPETETEVTLAPKTEAAPASEAEPAPAPETEATPAPGAAAALAPEAGQQVYRLPEGVELKYVDETGLAQRFNREPLDLGVAPHLLAGASVTARVESEPYRRIDKSYQMLSDSYLEDLMRDVSRRRDGAETFDTGLSRVIDADEYLMLVDALATKQDQEGLRARVAHLVVDTLTTES